MAETTNPFETFVPMAGKKLSFLTAKGFQRSTSLEERSGTTASVVFVGKYVGLKFYFDLRDQYVGSEVIRVENGELKPNWKGGYSSDLFGHLVRCERYRGGVTSPRQSDNSIEQAIDGWISLLVGPGQKLLEDKPDSLPEK